MSFKSIAGDIFNVFQEGAKLAVVLSGGGNGLNKKDLNLDEPSRPPLNDYSKPAVKKVSNTNAQYHKINIPNRPAAASTEQATRQDIIDYKVVTANGNDSNKVRDIVNFEVRDLLSKGWSILGEPHITSSSLVDEDRSFINHHIAQTMVLYAK